jgi:hypothetical protein
MASWSDATKQEQGQHIFSWNTHLVVFGCLAMKCDGVILYVGLL